jgi:serine protease inhibitor
VLPKMGLPTGFDPKLAYFSRMTDQKVYIGDVIETTTIEVCLYFKNVLDNL